MKRLLVYLFLFIVIGGCDKTSSDAAAPGGNAGGTGTGGSMARFTIVGNHLYTVDDWDLNVFDITNPSQPQFRKKVRVGFEIETIFPFKDKLFIGSSTVVHIFDISNPENPSKLSEAISPQVLRRCDPVIAKDTVAYATLRANGTCGGNQSILAAYDIKDVTKPVQRGFVNVKDPFGLGYSGNTLYVCDKQDGLLVFNIEKAFEPVKVKTLTLANGYFIDVIPYGNVLVCWVSDGLVLYDITNKENPLLLKKIS